MPGVRQEEDGVLRPMELDICNNQNELDVDLSMIRRTVEYVVDYFKVANATVSLAIVADEEIQELKGRYFGEFYATDVISFNLQDTEKEKEEQACLDCEVVINAQRAKREADEKGCDPQAELNLYLVHGLLHQLGYDDATQEKSLVMHEKEDELLQKMGLGKVYSGKD